MDLADAKRLKELEKENAELKKMLGEAVLKNRVLEEVNAKNGKPSARSKKPLPMVGQRLCSERRACRYLDLYRSTYRYPIQPPRPRQIQLQERIVALSWQYPRYGYHRIRAVLAREGQSSRKQVQRIPAERGSKAPKPTHLSTRRIDGLANAGDLPQSRLDLGFCFDRTDKGSTLKMLTMLNEFTRQCVAIRVERQIRSE